MASLPLPQSSRGTWLLCCVALCLLGAGSADVGVTQSPRHLIKGRGGKAVLKCHPISGHKSLLWYQQTQGQGPQFLVEYYEKAERDKGKISDHFSFKLFSDYSSELTKSSLQLEDSAVYLCASSLATAWNCHLLPAHKPHPSLTLQRLKTINGSFIALHSPTKRSRFGHPLSFG